MRNSYSNYYNRIVTNNFKIIFIVVIFYLLFKKGFEHFFTNTFVQYGLIYIDSSIRVDILFLIFIVVLLFIVRKNINSKGFVLPYSKFDYLLFFINLFYLYYRFFDSTWIWTSFNISDKIKYADVLIIILFCQIVIFFFHLIKQNKIERRNIKSRSKSKSFFYDEPIRISEDDLLGYKEYAKNVSEKINNSYFDYSFAIGVNADWGTGKTSFFNLLKQELEQLNNSKSIITIDFKPWRSNTPEAILKDFFETLNSTIHKNNRVFNSKVLTNYSQKLLRLNENNLTNSLLSITNNLILEEKSLNELYNDVKSVFKSQDKKIVIYIDDLDRLESKEIIEVIRLIRNTANFPNTFFIVAYERRYIEAALKSFGIFNSNKYLDKIFQLEINLPLIDRKKLYKKLLKNIKSRFSESVYKDIQESFENKFLNSEKSIIIDFINNPRDITRLANAFYLNYSSLESNVCTDELILLEILRLKYPFVYNIFRNNISKFVWSKDLFSDNPILELSYKDISVIESDIRDLFSSEYKYNFEYYLIKNKGSFGLNLDSISKITKLLVLIFSYTKNTESITYKKNINNYFSYSYDEKLIPSKVFRETLELPYDQILKDFDEWIENGRGTDIRFELEHFEDFKDKAFFEKIIKLIFYLCRLSNKDTKFSFSQLMESMIPYEDSLHFKLYKSNLDEYKIFIKKLFDSAQSPFTFDADFLRFIRESNKINLFLLNKEETLDYNINYLKKYCEQEEVVSYDYNIYHLFHKCKTENRYEKDPIKRFTSPSESINILIKFLIEKDINSLLALILDTNMFSENKFKFVNKTIIVLFNSFEEFEDQIKSIFNTHTEYKAEIEKFYIALKGNSFDYLHFEFKDIPIDDIVKMKDETDIYTL